VTAITTLHLNIQQTLIHRLTISRVFGYLLDRIPVFNNFAVIIKPKKSIVTNSSTVLSSLCHTWWVCNEIKSLFSSCFMSCNCSQLL